jgi:DnaJ-class molecular chaperone
MSNLVELMLSAYLSGRGKYLESNMERVLSVVKEHIGEVAMVCPRCSGRGGNFSDEVNCICHGTGVIARTESRKK